MAGLGEQFQCAFHPELKGPNGVQPVLTHNYVKIQTIFARKVINQVA